MLDFAWFGKSKTAADVQVFMTWDTVGNAWYPWVKPRGRTMAHLICVGGGGAGGNGTTGIAGTNRGGGGGGGSGAVSRLLIPMFFLPDRLFVQPGQAQVGTGGITYIATSPSNAAINLVLSAAGGAKGGNSAVGAGGAGGTAAGISAATISPFLGWGIFNSIAGQAGAAGGTNGAVGANIALGGASPLSGGAGGGGVSSGNAPFAGGNITGNLPFPTILGGATGINGNGGIDFQFPLLFCGGSGGGGSATVGGAGGPAARGCGAGGSGGGTTGGTGPIGGPGIAWIISF